MSETSRYNFFPYINTTKRNINNILSNNEKTLLNSSEQNTYKTQSLNDIRNFYFKDSPNFQKIQLIRKINSKKNPIFKNSQFYLSHRYRFNINKNVDITNINNKFSNSLTKFNNSDISKTFYLNKDSPKSLLESNINNSKNSLILDLNTSDSFNKTSSCLFNELLAKLPPKNHSPKSKSKKIFVSTIYKFTPFFKKSKNDNISARQIYHYYLKKSETKTPKNTHQFNGTYDYTSVMFPKLKNLYGENPDYINNLYEIKKNDNIAKKKDFNIKEYQGVLMKLLKKNISEKNMKKLKYNYDTFNAKNYGIAAPKGKYIDLAKKLKNHLSNDSYQKILLMDRKYRQYLEKKKEKNNKKKEEESKNKRKNKFSIKKIKIKKKKNNIIE